MLNLIFKEGTCSRYKRCVYDMITTKICGQDRCPSRQSSVVIELSSTPEYPLAPFNNIIQLKKKKKKEGMICKYTR